MKTDVYLALLALAVLLFTWDAFGREKPGRPLLTPLGLAVTVLAVFLKAAAIL